MKKQNGCNILFLGVRFLSIREVPPKGDAAQNMSTTFRIRLFGIKIGTYVLPTPGSTKPRNSKKDIYPPRIKKDLVSYVLLDEGRVLLLY